MRLKCLDIAASAALIGKRRQVLEPALQAFAPLLAKRKELAQRVAALIPQGSLPRFNVELAGEGRPMFASLPVHGFGEAIFQAAKEFLPLLLALEGMGQYSRELENLFNRQSGSGEALLAATLSGSEEDFIQIAREHGLPPAALDFAAEFIISAVTRAAASLILLENGEGPWDGEGLWSEGYCPVCGGYPSIAWLDRPQVDEQNAFLAGGGGKKHFHCTMCGSNWKFRRSLCPACGKEGSGTIEILREEGGHGERLDWCVHCKTYCPTIDLREMIDIPDLDLMVIGMLHLDMVASGKNLTPLRYSFWNTF